ncbi:hypothetical protein NIES2104_50640 [Leptolyngbya sp. NIES-2104]|nr:hypothetical protein NIES2104_50640 [Leptolyngbya sp. NIES-2104]
MLTRPRIPFRGGAESERGTHRIHVKIYDSGFTCGNPKL